MKKKKKYTRKRGTIWYLVLETYNVNKLYCICDTLLDMQAMGEISFLERNRALKEIKQYAKTRKILFTYDGTPTTDKTEYLWKRDNVKARLRWLKTRVYRQY